MEREEQVGQLLKHRKDVFHLIGSLEFVHLRFNHAFLSRHRFRS
jgi:hypothetical protein